MWLPGEINRMEKETQAQVSQQSYLSPTQCNRGKQSNLRGEKSKVTMEGKSWREE